MQVVALKCMVVAMMLAVGVGLRPIDLWVRRRHLPGFLTVIGVNLLLFPAVVVALLSLLELPAGMEAGIVLVAAAPGGSTGTLFALWGRAHVGFATALMVCLSLIALFSAPLTVLLVLGEGGAQVAWPMLQALLLYQVLPLVVAMAVRRFRPRLADRLARPLRLFANGLLGLIVVALLATRWQVLLQVPMEAHAALAGLVLVCLAPALLSRGEGRLRAAAIITSVHNLSVSLMLAAAFFEDPLADMAILAWGAWMMGLPAIAAAWVGRRDR